MYEVCVEKSFASGHSLRNYHGKCENVHGHNYRVQVTVQGEQLAPNGLLVDFVELKRLMMKVVDYLDHQFINDLPPFTVINPSAENIAKYFYDEMAGGLKGEVPVRISEVKVWETDTSIAAFRP
jgi:6-pyruvoyltetrahydropterin/6-carboxytetrahydropterin synthase